MFTNSIILILASLGLFQAFFLSIYLFTLKKGNRKSNVFLALLLLGLTIRLAKSVIGHYIPLEAWERNIGISGIFLTGPFLWFYGMSLLEKNKPFSKWKYLHLLPLTIFILLIDVIPSTGAYAGYWNYGLVVLHLAIYLILSWVYFYKNRLKAPMPVLSWYRNILIGVSLVWLYYLGNFYSFNLHYITGPIFYTFLIYAFTFLFLNRYNFSLDKYSSSNLDRTTSINLFQKIELLFTNEHIFLDASISLNTIAKKLSVSQRVVSQVINENEQQNFYEFVNHHRLEKAMNLMTDPSYKDEKIATIAYDSGFGSVTSFNVAFKKKMDITPSAYRKQHV